MNNEYDVKISHLKSVSYIKIYELLQQLSIRRELRIHNKLWGDTEESWNYPTGYMNLNENDTIEDIYNELEI